LIPNEVYKVTPPSNRVLRISSAALDLKGIAKDSKASLIVFDATKSQEFVICTLISGVLPHTHLDLFFVADREVTFKVSGNSNINLTGYTTFIEPGLMGPDSESDLEMPMPTSLPTQDVPKKKSKKKMEDPSANGEDKESAKNVKKGKKKKDKGSHKTIVDELEGGLLEESSEGEGMIGTHGAHDLALGLDPDADDDSLLGGDIPKAAKKEKKKEKVTLPTLPIPGKSPRFKIQQPSRKEPRVPMDPNQRILQNLNLGKVRKVRRPKHQEEGARYAQFAITNSPMKNLCNNTQLLNTRKPPKNK